LLCSTLATTTFSSLFMSALYADDEAALHAQALPRRPRDWKIAPNHSTIKSWT
jgi:hypothetical protein